MERAAPAVVAQPLSLQEQADKALRELAIEELTWRLKSHKTVGGVDLAGILDGELDHRGEFLLRDLMQIIDEEDPRLRSGLVDDFVDGMIERFLSRKGDLIEEEAQRIEADQAEDHGDGYEGRK